MSREGGEPLSGIGFVAHLALGEGVRPSVSILSKKAYPCEEASLPRCPGSPGGEQSGG